MKLLILFLLTLSAFAAEVVINWDPMPAGQSWKQVRIYERTGSQAPFTYTKVAEVTGSATSATLSNVVPGIHHYVARSVDGWESIDSNVASTPAAPDAPKGVLVTVTVTVSVSP